MAALSRPRSRKRPMRGGSRRLWFEKLMALIALVNLVLVLFDVSYVPLRDVYLHYFPGFTQWYGQRFKGIEPERSTVAYLQTVDALEDQVAQAGLRSQEAQELLLLLQDRSASLIDENPFQVANKSGTLERIKNLMRDRTGLESSKNAFQTFWSRNYLTQNDWSKEIAFFNASIRPLMETNYYRPIWEDGLPLDLFWQIDIWFVAIFGVEFLLRTFYLSRRYKSTSWLDAVLWRWYDLIFLITALPWLNFFRWLRVIPVTIRVNQSGLINLEPLRNRINRILITQFAIELTEVVVLRVIDQIQNLIQQGTVTNWILAEDDNRPYIDINGVNELQVILQRLITVAVYQSLPQVKPEIDAILSHSIDSTLKQAPAYQTLQQLPGMGLLSHQLMQQISAEVTKNLYAALIKVMEDEQGAALTQKLLQNFGQTFRSELQKDQTIQELQHLTVTLLEEVKINYVQQLQLEDIEKLQQKTYQLYEVTQKGQRRRFS